MTPLEEKIEEGVKYLLTYPEVRASASMESDIRLVLNSIATQAVEEERKRRLQDIEDWWMENEHPDELGLDIIKDIINRDKYSSSP